ncbi:restriction endonuclease subunit S [Synechococcus elongatus]|uniref:restriction endonuclease subunit S n=1 Tax=Synechococcus elongatus TaxID=32046 RepID=UPI0030D45E37
MSPAQIFEKIQALPLDKQTEVLDLIEFLASRSPVPSDRKTTTDDWSKAEFSQMPNYQRKLMKTARYIPQLRFPEFQDMGDWQEVQLQKIAVITNEKAGNNKFKLMSITSGVGLVSQLEKFGRQIAGAAHKNYFVIHKNYFAYNKSATKDFPEGFIALYSGEEPAAVPNSIFVCFKVCEEKVIPQYLQYLFLRNLHGKWLRKYLTIGARVHGSLNVDNKDLLALPIPLPSDKLSLIEQKKIADCLASIDDRITIEIQKLEVLKNHKKGLIHKLFPANGQTLPLTRFPEFQNSDEWKVTSLGEVSKITSGGTPNRSKKKYWNGNIPWITTSLINFNIIYKADEFISEDGLKGSSAKLFPADTILIAMYGQGKTRGKVAILGTQATTNQACAAIILDETLDTKFLFHNLAGRYDEIRKLSNSGGQENLSTGLIKQILISYPADKSEQQKISKCFTSLDKLINLQTKKIDTLKLHRNGLMQQLFPAVSENSR